jgi:hypothetical protein
MKTTVVSSVQAILEGGPETIPAELRIQEVSPLERKIKLLHYGGYEHFERVSQPEENTVSQHPVYRWTTRTEIAE